MNDGWRPVKMPDDWLQPKPIRYRLWLSRILAAVGWCVLAAAAYVIWWTWRRYELGEKTISQRVRIVAFKNTKEQIAGVSVAIGLAIGVTIGVPVGMFVSHFLGWT